MRFTSSINPAHEARDAVDRNMRVFWNGCGGAGNTEHHRRPALPRQRGQMRGAAAQFGDHAGDMRKNMRQRRPGHPGDQNVAMTDSAQFTFTMDHPGASGSPADTTRMAAQCRAA